MRTFIMFTRSDLSSPNYHSATMLKNMMKMANTPTQFAYRLEVRGDKFLRTCLLLALGLGLEVELSLENLLISCVNMTSILIC